MIVGRGGGSIEDLWALMKKLLLMQFMRQKHQLFQLLDMKIDYMISDFVADIRAATPSNAIEIAFQI